MNDGIAAEALGCQMGDQRLNKRYRLLLDRLSAQPGRSIPVACQSNAEVDAAYRFLDNPKVTPQKILAPHRAATLRRMAQEQVVVVAQDTTKIDLTRPNEVVGGPLSDLHHNGFYSHSLLALTTAGVPLGILHDSTIARKRKTFGQSRQRRYKAKRRSRESIRWLNGYQECCKAARETPGAKVICVSDSEGDLYEALVAAEQEHHAAHFIVRACQNRRLVEEVDPKAESDSDAESQTENIPLWLFEQVAQASSLGDQKVNVSARTACPSEKRRRKVARRERTADLTIRAITVTPRPPKRKGEKLPAVTVTAVLAREEKPPEGEEPIEWLLLTDLPATTYLEATQVLDWYGLRWQIEVFFRVLKSGCGVEKLQLETPERMRNALAIYRVVAWRVMMLTMLGRCDADLPCETLLSEAEWKATYVVVTGKKLPKKAPKLGEMMILIARLGGYQNRNSDPPPGPKAIWTGLQQVRTLAIGWNTFGPGAKTTYGE